MVLGLLTECLLVIWYKMAVAKFGAIVTDVKGKLGGHVFQGNGFTTTLRTGYSGKGGFYGQNKIFQPMNNEIDEDWRSLSLEDKEAWSLLASKHPIPDNFGNVITLTGQNLHRRNYTAFYASGQTGVIDPGSAIGVLPSSNLQHVMFRFSSQRIDVQFKFDRFSTAIIIYALPVLKFNLSIQSKKLPFLYGEKDETPSDDLLWNAFFVKYPNVLFGDPVQFGVVQVNEYGFKSFVKTVYATYV